ncbi:C2H2 finger domain transcription factor crzA [Penicillium canariense]|uniref:C2H2 finger domain transcription factor crzA n=1 Tax=Penicillium canariense TaxID=189055 RepID=A0A9W9HW10_9EURO|nr:C2H2 finger domain transcription factor crzA [Penicillium canariense]KAJ5157464.1 C2H2 finger domain transcription factor crzA [Penicillium canariense]
MTSHDHTHGAGTVSADMKHRSVSPSAHAQQTYHDPTAGLALNHSMSAAYATNPSYDNTNADPSISGTDSYGYSAAYLSGAPQAQGLALSSGQPFPPTLNTSNIPMSQSFDPTLVNQLDPGVTGLQQSQATEDFSNLLNSNAGELDFSAYQNHSPNSASASEYDSSLLLDPQMHQRPQSMHQAVNPADLVSPISNPSASSHPSSQDPQQSSPAPMSPPGSTPGTYYTPQHSRHTSLDPATAVYLSAQSNADWQSVMNNTAFQGHRRAPSEVSEVSSANHSPYLSQHEYEGIENNASPSLAPQNDPALYDNALGIEQFTLSEQHQQGFSPAHSPYISPRLMPQQGNDVIPSIQYASASNQFPPAPTDLYGLPGDDMMGMNPAGDIGQASQMAPPSINVEFAPPSRIPSFGPSKPATDLDSLRSRVRSKSDPYTHPTSRQRSPATSTTSLEPLAPTSPRSLSPHSRSSPSSREASPSRSNRRLSTSSIESRNYILDLADPGRPGAAPGDSKRVQKHPATFQCTLCPKRFTRAYNLRSHLRTHTDERPFVCTVCGKAFARQHDRKRHEGLHSGEKKFVCRGDLSRGGHWGCGRRFARADALGRHFRSEAGRVCIKPLLDEESQERERIMVQQQQQQQPAGHLQPVPQPLVMPGVPGIDGQPSGNFVLPAALLAQYPALQTLQWDQIPAAGDDPSDMGGRSSFDASSGGEFGFDDDESGISSVSGMSTGYGNNQGAIYGGQMLGVNPGDPGYVDQQKWSG